MADHRGWSSGDGVRMWPSRARRWLASVRIRMLVGYMLLLAGALTVATVVTRQVQLLRADREIEREQAQEVEELRRLTEEGIDPRTGRPFGTDVRSLFVTFLERNVPSDDEAFFTLVDGVGHRFSNESPPLFDDPQFQRLWNVETPTHSTTSTNVGDVGEVRSLAVPLLDANHVRGVFVVASFPADDYREVDEMVRVIVITGLAVLVITMSLAWSLAGRVLRPVRDLTATARQISDSELSARIPVEGRDELAELGSTFNDMVDRLEHGFTSQRRFVDDLAHELRTPITIALGHLDLLGDDPDERLTTVAIITDELERMNRYVDDLLLLAKAEHADFLATEPVDLGELARDLHRRLRAIAPRSWVLDSAPDVGRVRIVADPERLTQAVLNLASNAVQHTGTDAEIGLGVALDGSIARLWVRDTGGGVDPSIVGTLFDRYTRGAASRTSRPDGAGIGLSIVDAIARAHGGSVAVDNRPGHGATFVISVPSGVAPWAPPAVPAASPPTEPVALE